MMESTPLLLSLLFLAITVLCIIIFYKILVHIGKTEMAIITIILLSSWAVLQSILAYIGFYNDFVFLPPKLAAFGVIPGIIFIIILFLIQSSRNIITSFSLETLTWIHFVRLPVEIGLYYLCVYKLVSPIMTFEGRNFDIIMGITAPLIAYYGVQKQKLNTKIILAWNILGLILLINVVSHAILSMPYSFQIFSPEQPNIAVFYFPYVLLPTIIVPTVFFSHIAGIYKLIILKNNN